MPKTKDVLLKEIIYKTEKIYGFLSGIQLKFTNGFSTPMFETQLAKDDNHEMKKVPVDPTREIRRVKVRYEEFPDRNTYIHGLAMEDKESNKIVDLIFANYRSRETTETIAEGHHIIGLQVNTKSHPDHISRLGFVVWGPTEHKRTPAKVKESKAKADFCKDLAINFIFLVFSLVPLAIAVIFIAELN